MGRYLGRKLACILGFYFSMVVKFSKLELWNAIETVVEFYKSDGFDLLSIRLRCDFMSLRWSVLGIFSEIIIPKGLNCVALMPMIEKPIKLTDFRPLSLPGSIYLLS